MCKQKFFIVNVLSMSPEAITAKEYTLYSNVFDMFVNEINLRARGTQVFGSFSSFR
jgi:hypothetical protein